MLYYIEFVIPPRITQQFWPFEVLESSTLSDDHDAPPLRLALAFRMSLVVLETFLLLVKATKSTNCAVLHCIFCCFALYILDVYSCLSM